MDVDHAYTVETRYPEAGIEWIACCSCGWVGEPSKGRYGIEYAHASGRQHVSSNSRDPGPEWWKPLSDR
jgi:hypothetical protein